ncbi:MAG TPA: RtcB family protein [Pseudonocardia sp.]|nr:RtcB family protein [Pseudonocardia sp.]
MGSVVPTKGAVIPSCVGVDIGCGMVASETTLTVADLPADLARLMPLVSRRIPSGVGKGHTQPVAQAALAALGTPRTELTGRQQRTAAVQFGTLGSGNHFAEVCTDERGQVWTLLHSGSRGIGNQLAMKAVAEAKGLMKERFVNLEDPDLAYLAEGEPAIQTYIADMLWAQAYAMASRQVMAKRLLESLFEVVGHGRHVRTINCHHNFTQLEEHAGQQLWITRKGAIKAAVGDEGLIPGSMGTRSYVVAGLGSTESYTSCSHGAGRRLSRGAARRTLSVDSLRAAMGDRAWNDARPSDCSTSTRPPTRTSTRSWPTRPTWSPSSTPSARSSTTRVSDHREGRSATRRPGQRSRKLSISGARRSGSVSSARWPPS